MKKQNKNQTHIIFKTTNPITPLNPDNKNHNFHDQNIHTHAFNDIQKSKE